MKIIIIAFRHWSAGRRYRSLALNAKRLGHQVWGFSGAVHGDDDLTIAAFKELDVEAYHGNKLKSMIDQINPDLACGERYHKRWPVEMLGQDWITSHNKVGFVLLHAVMGRYGKKSGLIGPRTHLLMTSEFQEWPDDQVHVLGAPGFDWVTEKFDIPKIRAGLEVQPNQPLIGLFPDTYSFSRPEYTNFLNEAKRRNWRVVMHPHPMVRRSQNGGDGGFLNPTANKPALQKAQGAGAAIVVDYAPGTIAGIKFTKCPGFALIAAADCLLAAGHDTLWEAYAMKKRCHLFTPSQYPNPDVLLMSTTDWDYEIQRSGIEKVQDTLDKGSNDIEQDPELITKFLYKIDGLWWQRALDLAQKLVGQG